MDPDTRRLMMFAGGLGAVLVVLIGASALTGRHTGEVPVVTADPRPIREKPANPGGMKIDGAENDVFSGGSDTSNAKLAPAPESPDTKGLRADGAPISAPLPTPLPAPPAAAVAAPLAASADAPAAKAASPVAAAPPVVAKPAVVVGAPPKPTPLPAPSRQQTAEAAHSVEAAHPAEAARPEVAHPAGAGRTPMVQLAALASEEAARAEWAQLAKKMPELLNGKQPNYSRIDRDGHSYWRVRTSGFADVAQARSFCDHVRAKGGGCSVADF